MPDEDNTPVFDGPIKSIDFSFGELRNVVQLKHRKQKLVYPTVFVPDRKLSGQLKSESVAFLHFSLWATTLKTGDIKKRLSGLTLANKGVRIEVSIVDLPLSATAKTGFSFNRLTNGEMHLGDVVGVSCVEGQTFVLRVFFQDPDITSSEMNEVVDSVITRIRLTSSLSAASREIHRSISDINKDTSWVEAGLTVMVEESDNVFDGPNLEGKLPGGSDKLQIGSEAEVLIAAAYGSRVVWTRFLFLWLAFEAQTSENGKLREKYILEHLKSEIINVEALRLRDIRVKVAHGQPYEVESDDFNSIHGIVRLTTMTDSHDIESAVVAFERWVKERG